MDHPSVDSQRRGRSSHDRLLKLQVEARGWPELRGVATAAGVLAAARASGAPLRQAAGLGLIAGLARREVLRARHESLRGLRNSADASALAGWLGDRSPPLGTWAIEPDFGRLIAGQLMRLPETVVECGSGTTTLLIGGFLSRNGRGRLISLEHDSGFAESTQRQIEAAGLSDVCEIIYAPLKSQVFDGEIVDWYDLDCLGEVPEAIDLLVVDGPPADRPWARWPALGVFGDRLRPNASILVDDGRRREERRTVFRWLASRDDLELYWYDTIKGSWQLVRSQERKGSKTVSRYHAIRRALNPCPAGFERWPVHR
jgi:Methyltransferase domain